MNTVELLERALDLARQAGYHVRQEWLGECDAGACIIKGKKWLFIDPLQSPREQLEMVLTVLQKDAGVSDLPSEMQRKAA